MRKKFLICTILLLFLAGCGASGSAADAVPAAVNIIKTAPKEEKMIQAVPEDPEPEAYDAAQARDGAEESSKPEADRPARQYFSFDRKSSEENEDEITLLVENRCDVSFVSENPELQKWVDGILSDNRAEFDSNSQRLLQYAQEVISVYGPDEFYTYSNYEDRGIVRHDGRVVSLLTISHIQSGGAHPSTVQTAINLDLREKQILKLEDVIYEDGAEALEQTVRNSVKHKFERLDVEALYEDYSDTISVSMTYGKMTPYWYFGADGLVIFYNQYELGPYSAGIIKVQVPYGRLHGILREEFFPEVSKDTMGDLTVVTDAKDRTQIPCVIDPDGGQLLIGVTGTVRGVQVSEVLRVDETPVSQTMMMSISEMNEQDVLVLTGNFDDISRTFAVEFTDGSENRKTYYIHPDGLTEEP